MLDYFTHHFNPNNFTLAMTLLVKNEADIIESNIRLHALLGVDLFIVTDNGSTDGTREILSSLSQEYEMIIIDEPSTRYQQRKWVTHMAKMAKRQFGADWVINNDADEFWIPKNGDDLKAHLRFKGSVLTVQETNMLPTPSSMENKLAFFDFDYEVINPIIYRDFSHPNVSNILAKAGPKAIINPHGLFHVNSGNHSAEHIAFWKKQKTESIHIYQYPIRSLERFKRNVEMYVQILQSNPKTKIGKHWVRWVELYHQGKIEEEYARFVLNKEEIPAFERVGIIQRNLTPMHMLQKVRYDS